MTVFFHLAPLTGISFVPLWDSKTATDCRPVSHGRNDVKRFSSEKFSTVCDPY